MVIDRRACIKLAWGLNFIYIFALCSHGSSFHPLCIIGRWKEIKDNTHNSEATPEDYGYGGLELHPNPAYNTLTFDKSVSQDKETEPPEDDVAKVSNEEEPVYGNFEMLY